jgi:hypothetical protein
MHVFAGEGVEEGGVETDAEAPAGGLGRAVDGGFYGAAVGRLGAEARGAGISEDDAILLGDE